MSEHLLDRTMHLTASGDVELWLVGGEGWRFAVECVPYSEGQSAGGQEPEKLYLIRMPYVLTKAQHEVLKDFINQIRCHEHEWLVRCSTWNKFATKAPGITPAYYHIWAGVEPERMKETITADRAEVELSDNAEDFLESVRRQAGGLDIRTMRLVWAILCQEGARWLLKSGKSIDLGFCELHALPFRQNWKETLFRKQPELGAIMRLSKEERLKRLEKEGIHLDLVNFDNMEVLEGSYCGWTLEVIEKRDWDTAISRRELMTLRQRGRPGYLQKWGDMVFAMRERLLWIYENWLEKTHRAVGQRGKGDTDASVVVVPARRRGYLPRPGGALAQIPLCGPGPHAEIRGGEPEGLAIANALMHELPGIRQLPEELRDTRQDVGQPGDGEEGAVRMLVLPADEKQNGSGMLAVD